MGLLAVLLLTLGGSTAHARTGAELRPALTPSSRVLSASADVDVARSTLADSAGPEHAGRGDDDGRSDGERGLVEFETDDDEDDEQPDHSSVEPDLGPTGVADARGPEASFGSGLDAGHRLVTTGLARGPPRSR